MLDWIIRMFDPAGFPPRWHCGSWSSFLGWLHIVSDCTIWLAYMGIPIAILYFVRKRNNVPLLPVFFMFIMFIAFCGFGHLVEALMFWWPAYRFSGAVKLGTAIVSMGTLVSLIPFTRRALALPETTELLGQLRMKSAEYDQSKAALELTQQQLRMATAASGVGLWDLRIDSSHATWDSNTRRMFGVGPRELVGDQESLLAFVHPQDVSATAESLRATFEDGRPWRARFRIHRRDGSLAHIIARATAIRDAMNAVVGVSGSFFDVTDEENARLAMQSSLTEKETLLGEIHHRVKNNMQVVSSLLSLQANKIEEPRYREVLEDCRSRIRTMATIHETLYASRNFAAIDAGAYTREIAQMVFTMNARPNNEVQLVLALEPVMLDMASAIPLGLIINELVGNSLKHAFKGRSKGNLRLSLALLDETVQLCISDDGVGMRNNATSENATGMGLRLIRILVQQIDGEVAWATDHGTSCTLRFQQPPLGAPKLATCAAAERRE